VQVIERERLQVSLLQEKFQKQGLDPDEHLKGLKKYHEEYVSKVRLWISEHFQQEFKDCEVRNTIRDP
jgi:hypothetical protein